MNHFVHNISRRGQTALEYLLIFAIVAGVAIVSVGPLGVLQKAHDSAEQYFKKGARAIKGSNGENPLAIDGKWCAWKPCACGQEKQYRACECPAPAFGGKFCEDDGDGGGERACSNPGCPGNTQPPQCDSNDPDVIASCSAPTPPCETTSWGVDSCGKACSKPGPYCTFDDLMTPDCQANQDCTSLGRVVYEWQPTFYGCHAMYWDFSGSWCNNGMCIFSMAGTLTEVCPIGQKCDLTNPDQDTLPACVVNSNCATQCGRTAIGMCPPCCGNGRMDPGEECDRGALNGKPGDPCNPYACCNSSCQYATCVIPDPTKQFGTTAYCGGVCITGTLTCAPTERCMYYQDPSSACTVSDIMKCVPEGLPPPPLPAIPPPSSYCFGCDIPCGQAGRGPSPPCAPCFADCNDRIQNGGETGVDCGAVCGIPCPVKCGDGLIDDPSEQCDDGVKNGTPGYPCSAACTWVPNTCGNKIVEAPEQCDNGPLNGAPGGTCSFTCTNVPPTCGNGSVDSGEACDGDAQQCGMSSCGKPCYKQCLSDCTGYSACNCSCVQCSPLSTVNNGCPINFPGSNDGDVVTGNCGEGCKGQLAATCIGGAYYIDPSQQCSKGTSTDCPALFTSSNGCPLSFPASQDRDVNVIGACGGACSGSTINDAYCMNGSLFVPTVPGCQLAAGSCGQSSTTIDGCPVSLPTAKNGQTVGATCGGAGVGTIAATCSNGTYGNFTGSCAGCGPCGARTLTSQGCTVAVPAGTGTLTGISCGGGGCSGTVDVTCSGGTWAITNGACTPPAASCLVWGAWQGCPTQCNVTATATRDCLNCGVGGCPPQETQQCTGDTCPAGYTCVAGTGCEQNCPAGTTTNNGCNVSVSAGGGSQIGTCFNTATSNGCAGSVTAMCSYPNWTVTTGKCVRCGDGVCTNGVETGGSCPGDCCADCTMTSTDYCKGSLQCCDGSNCTGPCGATQRCTRYEHATSVFCDSTCPGYQPPVCQVDPGCGTIYPIY